MLPRLRVVSPPCAGGARFPSSPRCPEERRVFGEGWRGQRRSKRIMWRRGRQAGRQTLEGRPLASARRPRVFDGLPSPLPPLPPGASGVARPGFSSLAGAVRPATTKSWPVKPPIAGGRGIERGGGFGSVAARHRVSPLVSPDDQRVYRGRRSEWDSPRESSHRAAGEREAAPPPSAAPPASLPLGYRGCRSPGDGLRRPLVARSGPGVGALANELSSSKRRPCVSIVHVATCPRVEVRPPTTALGYASHRATELRSHPRLERR